MPLKIKQSNGSFPPGGFPFADPRTGRRFDGMSGDLNLQTQNVIIHRKANPKFYPPTEPHWTEPANVRQEIVDYICGQRPEICTDGTSNPLPAALVAQPSKQACWKCGGIEADPVYCKTCAGQRITGYKCKSCGTERPR